MRHAAQIRVASIERMIPKDGFNLVGVDDYEDDPADELYLIGHYATRVDAERELAARQAKNPQAKLYVYDPTMRGRP